MKDGGFVWAFLTDAWKIFLVYVACTWAVRDRLDAIAAQNAAILRQGAAIEARLQALEDAQGEK